MNERGATVASHTHRYCDAEVQKAARTELMERKKIHNNQQNIFFPPIVKSHFEMRMPKSAWRKMAEHGKSLLNAFADL